MMPHATDTGMPPIIEISIGGLFIVLTVLFIAVKKGWIQ